MQVWFCYILLVIFHWFLILLRMKVRLIMANKTTSPAFRSQLSYRIFRETFSNLFNKVNFTAPCIFHSFSICHNCKFTSSAIIDEMSVSITGLQVPWGKGTKYPFITYSQPLAQHLTKRKTQYIVVNIVNDVACMHEWMDLCRKFSHCLLHSQDYSVIRKKCTFEIYYYNSRIT